MIKYLNKFIFMIVDVSPVPVYFLDALKSIKQALYLSCLLYLISHNSRDSERFEAVCVFVMSSANQS